MDSSDHVIEDRDCERTFQFHIRRRIVIPDGRQEIKVSDFTEPLLNVRYRNLLLIDRILLFGRRHNLTHDINKQVDSIHVNSGSLIFLKVNLFFFEGLFNLLRLLQNAFITDLLLHVVDDVGPPPLLFY